MKGSWGLSAPGPPISALPSRPPPGGPGCDPLRGEPAITELDWSFAPRPRSWERIARQNPCGPPPGFRRASPCPGLDRSVSGLTAVTPGPFRPRPTPATGAGYGHVGFPTPSGINPLRLATAVNSPARVSRRKARPRSPPLVLPGRPGFLRGGSPLSSRATRRRPVSGSFHSPLGVLFSFPSRY